MSSKYATLRGKVKVSSTKRPPLRRSLSNLGQNVEKCGWLKKKGDLRYFVLRNITRPSLHWHKTPDAKERGRIDDLTKYHIFTLGPANSAATTIFKLVPYSGKREYILQANTNFEMHEWIKAINKSKRKYEDATSSITEDYKPNPFKLLPRRICLCIIKLVDGEDMGRLSRVDQFFKETIDQIPFYQSFKKLTVTWTRYLARGHDWFVDNPNKTKNLLREGVPVSMRRRLWMVMSNGIHSKEKQPQLWEKLKSTVVPQDVREKIYHDIDRTFPENRYFIRKEGKENLRTVLESFAIYNTTVGYTQGCNFITGVLLTIMPPEDAFHVLIELVNNYSFHGMYTNGFPSLNKLFWIFEQFLQHHLSSVYNHLKLNGITSGMFCTQWFITLFSVSLPMQTVYRIWDFFLVESWVFVIKIAVALLKLSKEKILHSSFEDILRMFQDLRESYKTIEDGEKLIQTALTISISQNQFDKYKRQYELENNTFLT